MAKKKDDGPPKKQKGPRRRSQRLNNRAEFRNTGPVGAAKRKIIQRLDDEQQLKVEEWDGLATRLITERRLGTDYPVGWTGDAAELKRKKEEWNRDWLAPSSDEQSDENNIEPTNDPAWMQVTDPASGDVYFWNIENDQTVWDIPEGVTPDKELSEFRGITKTIPDPSGQEGSKWLCTQTTSGHTHHGIFFQLEAKEEDVFITGIRTAAHYRSDIFEGRYRVLVRDGELYGNEYSKAGWRQVGLKTVKAEIKTVGPKAWDSMGLPRTIKTSAGVMFDMLPGISAIDTDPEVIYGSLPLSEAIHVPKGGKKAICIWNDDMLGIVMRKKDNFVNNGRFKANRFIGGFFDKAEVTDENSDLRIRAGLVPKKDVFQSVLNPDGYCAFVGVLQYVMKPSDVPEMPAIELDDPTLSFVEEEALLASKESQSDFVLASVSKTQAAGALEDRVKEKKREEREEARGEEDSVEGLDQQEEMEEEELMEGPEANFFGGGGVAAVANEVEGEGGAVMLSCFLGDDDVGELGVDGDTTWEELKGALKEIAGQPAIITFRHPDGVGEVKVDSESAWAAALEILLDEQWELDGYIDVDVKIIT